MWPLTLSARASHMALRNYYSLQKKLSEKDRKEHKYKGMHINTKEVVF